MEPVTQDFVEQTADFMMHLTKKQLDERVEELKKRQFNIHNIVKVGMMNSKGQEKLDYVFRMALIIVRVMESYEIKIPMISIVSIKEIINSDRKRSEMNTKHLPEEEKLQESLDMIGQPNYVIYLKEMVSTDLVYQSIFDQDESHNIFFIMMTIALVYSRTLERYS
jgi:hypothetical protein